MSHFDEHIFQMGWFNQHLEQERRSNKKNNTDGVMSHVAFVAFFVLDRGSVKRGNIL